MVNTMKIIAVANEKGGTGKTTTALMIAQGEALRGKRVLLVDLDQQGDATFTLSPAQPPKKSTFDLLTDPDCKLEDITFSVTGFLDLAPASPALSRLDQMLVGKIDAQFILSDKLEGLSGYDLVVIDTSPTLDFSTQNALTCADTVVIPVQADLFSLKGLSVLGALIKAIQKRSNPDLTVAGIVIDRYNSRIKLSKSIKQQLEEFAPQLGTKVFRTTIREATAVREAQTAFTSLFEYDSKGKATADANQFLDELEETLK